MGSSSKQKKVEKFRQMSAQSNGTKETGQDSTDCEGGVVGPKAISLPLTNVNEALWSGLLNAENITFDSNNERIVAQCRGQVLGTVPLQYDSVLRRMSVRTGEVKTVGIRPQELLVTITP